MKKLLTGLLILISHTTALAQLYFAPRVDYPLPVASAFVNLGHADYNQDGIEDLAVANFGANSVSIFIGLGGGTFGGAVNYATGSGPAGINSMDVNGDGNIDLVVANCGTSISVLFGNGSGSFGAHTDFATGSCPQYPVPGDFNEDGKIDFAVANYNSNTIGIHLGNGSGAFPQSSTIPTGSNPELGVQDLNSDGHLDLIVLNSGNGNISIRLGAGNGTFGAATNYATGSNPRSLAIGDFTSDGKLDLAVGNVSSNTVSILSGLGPGTFNPAVNFATTAPTNVIAGDYNADGKLDLAISNSGSNTVSIYTGSGAGTFSLYQFTSVGSNAGYMRLMVLDLNSDGLIDVVTTNDGTNVMGVLLGNTPTGGAGTALQFNGSNQEAQLGTWFNYQNFTISMWLKPGAAQNANVDIIDNNHTSSRSWVFQQNTTNTNQYFFDHNGPASNLVTLIPNVWQHVALVSVNGLFTIYLNGQFVTSRDGGPNVYDGTQSLRLANWGGGGRNWNGEMDEVRIFDAALTPSQIQGGMCGEIPTNTPNLIAYYRMNEGSGTFIYDGTANAYTGTLINGPTFQISGATFPTPTISGFSPTSGSVGTGVTITGTNFNLTPASNIVKFNGTTATVTASTTTSITTTVPAGATTGPIQVTVGCNTVNGANFTVILPPTITSFSPASGPVVTNVTIAGTNYSTTPANNIVYFGATRAAVTASTSTQLTVTVPIGATYQPISVTVNGLTAFSNKPFLVTFPDGGTIDACSFKSPLGFGPDSGGFGVAMGDLDGDGKTDVAVTDYFANSIRIFRNTSTPGTIDASSFAPSVNFGVGINPYEVSIADIDGDGKLDIIASNWNGSTISIFRNTSTAGSLTAASFAARLDLATGAAPFNISCQDLDGDGKTDIAVGNAGGSAISIWQNIGSPGSITAGSFNPRLDIAGPSSGFAIADVDVDGKPDLIAGYNLGSFIGVARNISSPGTLTTGSFASYVNFPVAAWPEHLVVGDLDADNRPDIVTSSTPGNKISILKNTSTPGTIGAGSFAATVDIDGNIEPRGVSITDYDGDGLPDIGLSNQTGSVSIYKNANTPGSITTASFLPKVNYSPTGNARDLASGDIDGDGKPDLVVAAWSSPSLMILRNTVSSLPLHTVSSVTPASGTIGTTVTIAGTNFSTTPLNNTVKFNGTTAIVTASTSTSITTTVPTGATTGTISVQVGCNIVTSSGNFTVGAAVPTITNFTPASGPIGTTETINGTNFSATPTNNIVYFGATKANVIAATSTQLTVTVPVGATYQPISVTVGGLTAYSASPFVVTFPGGGNIDACSFAPKVDFTTGSIPRGMVIGDLDGDGKTDLALVNGGSATLSTYLNTSTAGDITASSFAAPVDFITDPSPRSLAIGDVNGDGKLDLVCVHWPGFSVFQNTSTLGTISFTKIDFATGLLQSAARAAIGDLDGDGKPEIAIPNNLTEVSVFKNLSTSGTITFAPKVDYPVYGSIDSPYLVAIGDLDSDNKPDLAISLIGTPSGISVLRNTGTIGVIDATSFAPFVFFGPGLNPIDFAIADLDGDLKLDLAISNIDDNSVSILRNTSSPGAIDATSFAPRVDFVMGPQPNNIVINDLDGDGKPDLAIARRASTVLSVFKNTSTPGVIDASSFDPPDNFSTGPVVNFVYGIASGDLDGDGAPDLVVTNNKISILRNTVSSFPPPTISSFAPTSGYAGNTVTINGTNFSTTPLNNTVKFNGVAAVVTASTPTSITTTVPVGATTGSISIQVGCNTAFSFLPFTVTSCVPAVQSNALIALYNATNGASWTNNSGWLSPDVSTWYGVTLSGCSITDVDLSNNNLVGTLPAEIGDLTALSSLTLSFNHLSGALPASITNLTNLQILKLDNNNTLNGALPATIGNMISLQEINTQVNAFTGPIPASLVNCTALRNLHLEGNQHTGTIPTFLGSMPNLRSINLAFNQFNGTIPTQLGNLANLNYLSLASNALSGSIPAQLGNLNNLQLLDLSRNQLAGDIPIELGNILYLEYLQLWSNVLTGFIPSEFVNLSFLKELNLSQNKLEGYVPEIGFSDVLQKILLADNNFDFIDPVFSSFSELTMINLSNNRFASIPTFSSTVITQLAVQNNYLDFGSLEPNMGTPGYTYSPQAKIPPGGLVSFVSGGPLDILFSTTGSSNSYQWFKDGAVISGANLTDYSLASAGPAAAGKYYVKITSSIVPGLTLQSLDFVAVTSSCVPGPRLGGVLDNAYDPLVDDPVTFPAIEIQSSGKSIVATPAGTSINGSPYNDGLIRFNVDGSQDAFTYADYDPSAQQMIVQPDDKILVVKNAGNNTYLKRLMPDGSVDASFNGPSYDNTGFYTSFFGPIALQPNGNVLYSISNTFDFKSNLIRLNTDGSPDGTFNSPADFGANVIKVQADGKILVGGYLFGGITRLDASGNPDASFAIGSGTADDPVNDIVIQPDGKIILIGLFTSFNGETRNGIVRLNSDGSIDTSFDPPGISDLGVTSPTKVGLMSNGQIIIAGDFLTLNGESRKNLVRLNSDGSLDCTFDPGGSASSILDFSIQSDNKILIVGDFTVYDGTIRNAFARVNNGASGASCIPASERAALIALYNATNGATWTNKSNWLSADESTWFGITVNSCHVTEIALDNNNLVGTLPTVLDNLPSLTNLSVAQNKLTGTIPTSLGNLPSLIYLQLWSNQLTGSIPVELGSITTLITMNLSDNKLAGNIPIQLGNLINLQFLELWGNQLIGNIPSQLGNIPTLAFLRLSSNLLTGSIPSSLGSLSNLFLLDLNQNQLDGSIPVSLGSATKLKYLVLNTNKLTGPIPIELGNLILLEDLLLYSNKLSGTLPKELSTCTKLKRFGVGDNLMTGGLPKEYGSWTDLEDFGINNNTFAGAVPVEYLLWTKLIRFYLSGNKLDAIPTFTAGTITEFNVDNNFFEFGDLEPNIAVTGYNYTPQADLPGGVASANAGSPLTIPFITSGTANLYQWFKNSVLISGATSATFTIASSTLANAGNYNVEITSTIVPGLTLKSQPFVVTITPVIIITLNTFDVIVCDGNIGTFVVAATGTTNITYQWQYSPDSIVPWIDLTNFGGYSGSKTPTLSINTTGTFGAGRYRCRINGDLAIEVLSFDEGLFINPKPSPPTTTNASSCATSSLTLTASGTANGNYRWYTLPAGGAIAGELNSTYTTPILATTTTYYASINISGCESSRTPAIATVTIVSKPTVVTSNCTTSSATLTGPSGFTTYAWSNAATTQQITVTLAGTYTLIVTDAGGCSSPASTPVTFTSSFCNQPPVIATTSVTTVVEGTVSMGLTSLLSDPDNNLDLSTLKIFKQPTSGAVASIGSNATLRIDYTGKSFAGTDQVTIEVCDLAGFCTQQIISIEVAGEIIVFNGISPNGNGQNDAWIIQYIELLPETKANTVSIFNRWGDEVFSTSNYDNASRVFKGLNKSGDDLPTGTYFYKIEFASGRKTQTGYLSLKR